ncbi:SMP-30/gluconolactonase/LRE family protein [Mycobacterium cookii]|uniref:Gluconolactonase n=1 Tax=Mycobacterium cookii TaxID=1775 RepID=A0A7I7L0F6_9MYCO|nr:SMP-30/gluconolactonase/LRE family protein [Mycobacterium cookii]MCV7329704.1 SMP-30/gluconolactonase/LRE family protein [Mycobacterium cookii]BBX47845.1 gluconolactonase [Mycobacterium cookii]
MLIDVIADGLGFTEGPVWLPDNRIALTSISHGCVYIVDPDEGPLERIDTGGGPNGLACDTDGTLYVAQNGGVWGASGPAEPGVQVITGTQVDYLVEGLGAPNDLTFGPDGRLWITDTRSEFDIGTPGAGLPGHVYATDVASGETQLVIEDGPVFINGLGFDRDGSRLLVTATLSSQLLSYDYRRSAEPEILHTFDAGWPDGMAVSSEGHYWVALTAADRIDVIDTWGRLVVEIPLAGGSLPTNVCIGGRRHDELFVTAAHAESLLRIRFDGDAPPL